MFDNKCDKVMKSERARELIEKYAVGNSRDAAPCLLKRTAILCVELAEQDAEERMRDKAAKVYCRDCCCTVVGKCGIGPENCVALRDFILKLNEE